MLKQRLLNLSQKKTVVALTGSALLMILGLSAFTNSELSRDQNIFISLLNAPARGLASLRPQQYQLTRAQAEQFVKDIARDQKSRPAQLGRKPSLFDKLVLGTLEGKYQMRAESGFLKALDFSAPEGSNEVAKIIPDRKQFLEDHRELLTQAQIEVRAAAKDAKAHFETYELVAAGGVVLSQVQFQLDAEERLLSMTVIQQKIGSR